MHVKAHRDRETDTVVPLRLKIAAAVAIALATVAGGLVAAGWLAWGRGDGAVAVPMPDFATLVLHDRPNQYLALPPGFGGTARPHGASPVFDVPVAALEALALRAIRGQPRITEIASDPARRQYAFVQRTKLMRFPDTVTVRFVDLGDNRSSLALYSRSRIGHSDLGANAARAAAWIAAIAAAAEEAGD